MRGGFAAFAACARFANTVSLSIAVSEPLAAGLLLRKPHEAAQLCHSRFGDGDGSWFDRWLTAPAAPAGSSSTHAPLAPKLPPGLMRPLVGFKAIRANRCEGSTPIGNADSLLRAGALLAQANATCFGCKRISANAGTQGCKEQPAGRPDHALDFAGRRAARRAAQAAAPPSARRRRGQLVSPGSPSESSSDESSGRSGLSTPTYKAHSLGDAVFADGSLAAAMRQCAEARRTHSLPSGRGTEWSPPLPVPRLPELPHLMKGSTLPAPQRRTRRQPVSGPRQAGAAGADPLVQDFLDTVASEAQLPCLSEQRAIAARFRDVIRSGEEPARPKDAREREYLLQAVPMRGEGITPLASPKAASSRSSALGAHAMRLGAAAAAAAAAAAETTAASSMSTSTVTATADQHALPSLAYSPVVTRRRSRSSDRRKRVSSTPSDTSVTPSEAAPGRPKDSATTSFVQACRARGIVVEPLLASIQRSANGEGDLMELHLAHHGLGNAHAIALSRALATSDVTLRVLDLADNRLTASGGSAMLLAATLHSRLEEIDLSQNAIRGKAVDAAAALVACSGRLRAIRFSRCGLGDSGGATLARALIKSRNSPLSAVDFSHNGLGEKSATALAEVMVRHKSLTSYDLSWNSLRGEGAVAIADALEGNRKVRKVNCAFNGFASQGAFAMAAAVADNVTLEDLNLAHNSIMPNAALVLATCLATNSTLVRIDVSGNTLGKLGGRAFIRTGIESRHMEIGLAQTNLEVDDFSDSAFHPSRPSGTRTLDLSDPYSHAVAFELLRIFRDNQAVQLEPVALAVPHSASKTITLRRCTISGGPDRPSGALPTIAVCSDEKPDEEWELPTMGTATFSVSTSAHDVEPWRKAPNRAAKGMIRMLKRKSLTSEERSVLVRLAADDMSLTGEQASSIVNESMAHLTDNPASGHLFSRMGMAKSLLSSIVDSQGQSKFVETTLSADARARLAEEIGQHHIFSPSNPTDHYVLDLSVENDRMLLSQLRRINALESQSGKSSGLGDTSQHGDWQAFRNARLNDKPIALTSATQVPDAGSLEFDFASTQRPGASAAKLRPEHMIRIIRGLAGVFNVNPWPVIQPTYLAVKTLLQADGLGGGLPPPPADKEASILADSGPFAPLRVQSVEDALSVADAFSKRAAPAKQRRLSLLQVPSLLDDDDDRTVFESSFGAAKPRSEGTASTSERRASAVPLVLGPSAPRSPFALGLLPGELRPPRRQPTNSSLASDLTEPHSGASVLADGLVVGDGSSTPGRADQPATQGELPSALEQAGEGFPPPDPGLPSPGQPLPPGESVHLHGPDVPLVPAIRVPSAPRLGQHPTLLRSMPRGGKQPAQGSLAATSSPDADPLGEGLTPKLEGAAVAVPPARLFASSSAKDLMPPEMRRVSSLRGAFGDSPPASTWGGSSLAPHTSRGDEEASFPCSPPSSPEPRAPSSAIPFIAETGGEAEVLRALERLGLASSETQRVLQKFRQDEAMRVQAKGDGQGRGAPPPGLDGRAGPETHLEHDGMIIGGAPAAKPKLPTRRQPATLKRTSPLGRLHAAASESSLQVGARADASLSVLRAQPKPSADGVRDPKRLVAHVPGVTTEAAVDAAGAFVARGVAAAKKRAQRVTIAERERAAAATRMFATPEEREQARLAVRYIRAMTAGLHVTPEQAELLIRVVPPHMAFARVEMLVAVFSRLTDISTVWRRLVPLLGQWPDRREACRRLGWLNVINPMHAEGYYHLDLSVHDERRLAQSLVILAVAEPGPNITAEAMAVHGSWLPNWRVPGEWLDSVPAEGEVLFDYTTHQPGCAVIASARVLLSRRFLVSRDAEMLQKLSALDPSIAAPVASGMAAAL